MCIKQEEKPMTIEEYIAEKIRMLTEDFYIKLTETEILNFQSLKREIDVDRYAHDFIFN